MKRILIALAVVSLLLSAVFTASADEPATFKALRAVRISDTEVVVEFDKPLDFEGIDGAFTALRWETMEGDTPNGLKWSGETSGTGDPLQIPKESYTFWSDLDQTRIVLTFKAEDLDAYAETDGNQWYDMGCRAFLVMEENNPPAGHNHMLLDTVLSSDGALLEANILNPARVWDGVALTIEVDYDYPRDGFGETIEYTWPEESEPETEPSATEAPATAAPAVTGEGTGTSAPATEAPKESGCGSALIATPVLSLILLGGALLATKRR